MLFCDKFQRSLDDLPALKCGLVQVNSPCVLHVFSPTQSYSRQMLCASVCLSRVDIAASVVLSWTIAVCGEGHNTRCKRLHDVRLCDNTGLFVYAETFVFLGLTYYLFFVSHLLPIFCLTYYLFFVSPTTYFLCLTYYLFFVPHLLPIFVSHLLPVFFVSPTTYFCLTYYLFLCLTYYLFFCLTYYLFFVSHLLPIFVSHLLPIFVSPTTYFLSHLLPIFVSHLLPIFVSYLLPVFCVSPTTYFLCLTNYLFFFEEMRHQK
jgi:hypothetical protein